MICSRCQGLMTVDSFIDMEEDTGQLWLSAWRCVNCAQVTDPGIIRNRMNVPIADDRCHGATETPVVIEHVAPDAADRFVQWKRKITWLWNGGCEGRRSGSRCSEPN